MSSKRRSSTRGRKPRGQALHIPDDVVARIVEEVQDKGRGVQEISKGLAAEKVEPYRELWDRGRVTRAYERATGVTITEARETYPLVKRRRARQPTLVQLSDHLLAALDQRAASSGRSRSDLVRAAIESYLSSDASARVDAAIVAGYRRIPPEPTEPWAEASAIEAIRAEPW